jgi:thiosulfate dehydrogenase
MKFIFGVIVGIALVPGVFYAYCRSGRAPVAVSDHPFPFEAFFANTALDAKAEREAPRQSPVPATEVNLVAGAQTFARHCTGCHGLPGYPARREAASNFPHPPQLFEPGQTVADDPVGVTYWKVKNGIRLTAMPTFASRLPDLQIWQVSQLLKNAEHLPPAVQEVLAAAAAERQARAPR